MTMSKYSISVIIPTRNRTQNMIRCLESISIQTVLPDEVILVDASDTDVLRSSLSSLHPFKVKYIRSKPGLTLQRNIGIEASSGDIIVFLDDDMIAARDYIENIFAVFDKYPTEVIGGVTGNIISSEGQGNTTLAATVRELYRQAFAALFLLPRHGDGRFQLSGFPTLIKSGSVNKIINVEILYGGSMAFGREVITAFKFDENLRGYAWGEDDDIAYRVSRSYQNVYTPFARVVHNDLLPSTVGNKYTRMEMTMEHHYYLFKKNLPQDLLHKLAFWWSVIGLFLQEAIPAVKRRETSGLSGLMSGMRKVLGNKAK